MSISGLGSTGQSSYIEQLMYLEAKPLRDLQAKRSELDVRLGILTDLRTKIDAFTRLASGFAELGPASALRRFTVSSSDESVAVATASSAASLGSHAITVQNLAQAHTIASNGFAGSAGDIAAGSYTFEITVGTTTTAISVEIAAGDDNATAMQKVVDAIRAADAGLSADLVTVDTTNDTKRIVVSSEESGEANLIASVQDTSGTLMTTLGLAGTSSPGSFSANTTIEARDATFTLDGIAITSASNEVSGVLTGVVIRLLSPSDPGGGGVDPQVVDLTIAHDRDTIREKLDALVTAFNDLVDYLNTKLASGDETGAGRGELAGNLTFVTFRNELLRSLSRSVAGGSADVNTMDDVGLLLSRTGRLSLDDAEKFFNALTSNPDAVETYFGSADGVATRVETLARAFTRIGGALDLSRDLLDSRKDVLDLRIERMESFLDMRESQIRSEIGRLSQLVAEIGSQQDLLNGIFGSTSYF
jgi:flagellar hook-associated protein 2